MSISTESYRMVIGGAWTESESGERFEATSPATGETIGTVPEGTRDDARRAIAAANAARRDWASKSAFERAAALTRVADLIEERRDDLARTLTLDQGKPLHAESYGEVEELIVYWRMAAGTRHVSPARCRPRSTPRSAFSVTESHAASWA